MRVLFFLQPGTNSRSIFRDMIRGFEEGGHETIIWELHPVRQMYERHGRIRSDLMQDVASIVAALIRSNRVDLSVGMWASAIMSLANGRRNGEAATFFDLIESPHLMFWLDAPHWAHGEEFWELFGSPALRGPFVSHLINNPALAREMREVLGFGNVLDYPYGINEAVFYPVEARAEFDIVFGIGPGDPPMSPLMERALSSVEPDVEEIRAEQGERVRARLAEIVRRSESDAELADLCEELLAWQLRDRDTPILDRIEALCGGDVRLRRAGRALTARPALFVRTCMALRSVEHFERAFTICFLSRHLRCAVFGSGSALSGWDYRGERLGELSYEDQRRAYARGHIGLNVMRQQDEVGVNLKPLEISACARPCLMRERPGIERVLAPGEEIATFRTPVGALEAARALLDDDAARTRMADRAHARVLREHTWRARVGEILEAISIPR